MKYILIVFTLILSLAESSIANPKKSEVMKLLEGRHWHLNILAFKSLGDETDTALIDIASDTSLINYLRFRALEALSLFPSEKTGIFLEQTANNSFASLARRGFEAFKIGFSKSEPIRVENLAKKLLNHPNAQLRIAAARTVRSHDLSHFRVFMNNEKDDWVRKEAQK